MQGYSDYNTIPENIGTIQNVPAGGYVCDIKKVIVENNKNSAGQHLSVWFDIAEGDCRGWFEQDYKSRKRKKYGTAFITRICLTGIALSTINR